MALVFAMISSLNGVAADPDKIETLFFTTLNLETKKFSIVSTASDGSKRTTLTKGEDREVDPALSPDGKRIAFVVWKKGESTSDICVMNTDGTGRKTILKGEGYRFAMAPAWSPDCTKIAYTVPKDGVMVIDTAGKNARNLGRGMLADWSPDGKKILYTMFGKGGATTICVMDVDGKNAVELIQGRAMLGAYSPDGKRIVYMAAPDGPSSRPCIFIANADGKNATCLTKGEGATEVYPRWSADCQHIFFTRLTDQKRPSVRSILCVMDADGKNVRELTRGTEMDMLAGQGETLWLLLPQPQIGPSKIPPPKMREE